MGKVPLAIIDKDKKNINKISSLIKDLSGIEVVQTGTELGDLESILKEKIPTLVLLGPDYLLKDVKKMLIDFRASLHSIKVILLVSKVSTNLFKEAIKLDIHDVLEFPFAYNDLAESAKRAKDIFDETVIEKGGTSKEKKTTDKKGAVKITIFSPKGGTGKSFIATNLAVDMANFLKKDITIFDLNYQFGDVALMLNLFPKHTVYDIMSFVDALDSEMLNSFLTVHESGVKILPAPIDPTQDEAISTKNTKKILDVLSSFNDFIIIDTPSGFSENVLLLLEETDFLCVVTSMDVPSIKNLKITLQLLEQLKFPQEKIILILNRSDTKVGITAEEIKKTISKNIDVSIPSSRIVPLSVNKGIPVVIENPRSPVARNIHRLSILLNSKVGKQK